MEQVLFWVIYFGGLVSSFFLGGWIVIQYYESKRNSHIPENFCIDGKHYFTVDGTPNGTRRCMRCGLSE